MGGPIEWTSTEVFRAEMELNYFGLLNVAKGFIPLLRRFRRDHPSRLKARFIAVTSTIAVMPSFPGLSGYASSKSAADTLINTLRLEILPFGIDVITVCPGITRTPFLAKGAQQMRRAWDSAPEGVRDEYGEEYANWWAQTVQFGIDWLAHDPHDSVECLVDATSSAWPKTRYFSGLDARIIARPAVHLPDFAWDSALRVMWTILGQPRPIGARL
jgi:NAD(P)-dependent dehydrogenase (short-subunit alcohol dehydrogenase family)